MAQFEDPNFEVMPVGPLSAYPSGDELPLVPFGNKDDELDIASFN